MELNLVEKFSESHRTSPSEWQWAIMGKLAGMIFHLECCFLSVRGWVESHVTEVGSQCKAWCPLQNLPSCSALQHSLRHLTMNSLNFQYSVFFSEPEFTAKDGKESLSNRDVDYGN